MAPAVGTHHRRTLSGTLPADGANPAQIQPTSDYGDSHVHTGAAGDRQAMLSAAAEANKATWDWLTYRDSTVTLTNQAAGGLVQGDVLALAVPDAVVLADTVASQQQFVVCAEATLAPATAGRFWASAFIPVVKHTGAVTALHYVRKSATTKAVETTGVAVGPTTQTPAGALGLALASATVAGTIPVLWFPRPAPLLPPVTAGYVKGTGTGFAVQALPIPVADFATGTPTGGKFVRDDGVLAVPPSASPVLNRAASPVVVSNTITETTIYAFEVPGGTLGTAGKVRLVVHGQMTDTVTTGAKSLTVRLKYGATTLITYPLVYADATTALGTGHPVRLHFELANLGGTNNQLGILDSVMAALRNDAAPQASLGGTNHGSGTGTQRIASLQHGAAAVDSTAAQTLAATIQWGAASSTRSFTMQHATLELL